MLQEEAIIQNNFSRIIDGFGKNHARIYWSLINNLSKTATQIEKETQLAHNTVYIILTDLIQKGLINNTNTHPKLYYCRPTIEALENLVKKKKDEFKEEIQNAKKEIKKIVNNATSQSGEEYLIKINGGQTTLYNNKTKEMLTWKHEINQIKQQLDNIPAKTKNRNRGRAAKRSD